MNRRRSIPFDVLIGLIALVLGVLAAVPVWVFRPPIVDRLLAPTPTTVTAVSR